MPTQDHAHDTYPSTRRLIVAGLAIIIALVLFQTTLRTMGASGTAAFTAASEAELVTAINGVNAAGPGTHIITMTADITLTAPLPALNNPAAESILLAGEGHTLAGDGGHTVLAIDPATTTVIELLTITGGSGSSGPEGTGGGGIYNRGSLTINESIISDNAAVLGGGVLNESSGDTVAITNIYSTTLTGNQAVDGGAIGNRASGGEAVVNLNRATLSNNVAGEQGGAIVNWTLDGTTAVTASRSLIEGNSAMQSGGGLANLTATGALSKITMSRTTFSANTTQGAGGGVSISTESGSRSDFTITRSTFVDNTAVTGGGAMAQNSAGERATISATNVTVSSNDGGSAGGAISSQTNAGNATVSLIFSTVAGNTAVNGSGVYAAATGGSSVVILGSSILSGPAAVCGQSGGNFTSYGFNTGSDDTCNLDAPTDLSNVDPQLQPLAVTAPGETMTHALAPGSPAIDRTTVSYNGCNTTSTTDQRGAPRLQGLKCDGGAFELDVPALSCELPLSADSDASLNQAIRCANEAGAGTHTIDISGPITLAGPTNPLDNPSATAIIINGNGRQIDGNARGTIFTIGVGTTVAMNDLVVINGKGSSGANRSDAGGFYVTGRLSLERATISDNVADAGGGIFVNGEAADVTLETRDVLISGNEASVAGGGLTVSGNDGDATVTLESTAIADNSSTDRGGGIDLSGFGGVAVVTMLKSTLSGNASGIGGGVFVNGNGGEATLSIEQSTLSDNQATAAGGAIGINGNTGIADVTLLNSTVSGNSATSLGGAVHSSGNGGSASLEARYTTFAENTANLGSLLLNRPDAVATFTASILAGSSGTALCSNDGGSLTSGDYNVVQDDSCSLTQGNDISNGIPGLEPLALNTPGTTRTHALGSTSDARDHIPSGSLGCGSTVTVDQRGESRPQPAGGKCESGSYEVGQGLPPVRSGILYLPAIRR